jgi:hypothetical protein
LRVFAQRHDARMRFPWQKADTEQQLDLPGDAPTPEIPAPASRTKARSSLPLVGGIPRMAPTSQVDEDPANPRTEFPDAKVGELADDIPAGRGRASHGAVRQTKWSAGVHP